MDDEQPPKRAFQPIGPQPRKRYRLPPPEALLDGVHGAELAAQLCRGAHQLVLPPPPPVSVEPERTSDGRVRNIPFVLGNFPCGVYIPFVAPSPCARCRPSSTEPSPAPSESLLCPSCCVEQALRAIDANIAWQRFPTSELHLSLSRSLVLRERQIELLRESLPKALRSAVGQGVRRELEFHHARVFINEHRTRAFVGLCTSVACSQTLLQPLIDAVDAALADVAHAADGVPTAEHSCRPFYRPAVPHVSVAWIAAATAEEDSSDGAATASSTGAFAYQLSPAVLALDGRQASLATPVMSAPLSRVVFRVANTKHVIEL